MFEEKYQKFAAFINNNKLIDESTKKVAIAMSGGKDCQSMTALLLEYKNRERPELELELVTAAIPYWKFKPNAEITRQNYADKVDILDAEKRAIDENRLYWERKGIPTIEITERPSVSDKEIYDSPNPCVSCFIAVQQAFYTYFERQNISNEVRLAIGMTKWDILYTLIVQLLNSNGKTWYERKEEDALKYKYTLIQMAIFCPYPKLDLGIPNKDICKIQPMVVFNDLETKRIVKDRNLPIIPDICVDLNGTKFQSDKRHFDRFIKISAAERIATDGGKGTDSPFFQEYDDIIKLYRKLDFLPPIGELNKILYPSFMATEWNSAVKSENENVKQLFESANAIH